MSILDVVRKSVRSWLGIESDDDSLLEQKRVNKLRNYRTGNQPRQLKTKFNQADDNLVVNFCGLIVDRATSALFGKGVEFDFADGSDLVREWLEDVWDSNNEEVLLHNLGTYAGESGTGYIQVIPDGKVSRLTGNTIPRLILLDPALMTIVTDPLDWETVKAYVKRFNARIDGRDTAIKEVTYLNDETGGWEIAQYRASGGMSGAASGKWEMFGEPVIWDYEFPNILSFQNLPMPGTPYGQSDISDNLIEIQDRINFIASNVSKIIRYHAHPKTWGRYAGTGKSQSWGADEMVIYNSDNAMVANLEMQSDLSSSQAFMRYLRQCFFDISRSVDIDSFTDKLGSLTNFGLKVLYQDALSKIQTKQELYGDALIELNRRLLTIGGLDASDPGEIVWPEVLPVNDTEQQQAIANDVNLGILSKESAAGLRGHDWEQETERIQTQAASGDNVGAAILRAFDNGK